MYVYLTMPGTQPIPNEGGCYNYRLHIRNMLISQQQCYKSVYLEGILPKSSKGGRISHITIPLSS